MVVVRGASNLSVRWTRVAAIGGAQLVCLMEFYLVFVLPGERHTQKNVLVTNSRGNMRCMFSKGSHLVVCAESELRGAPQCDPPRPSKDSRRYTSHGSKIP